MEQVDIVVVIKNVILGRSNISLKKVLKVIGWYLIVIKMNFTLKK